MKRLLISIILLGITGLAWGQNEVDALRYSLLNPSGTARYMGAGGAFGALGGDMTTLGENPAGIAIFRKSEISLSPSFYTMDASSSFRGMTSDDSKNNFNFGNIGLVGTRNTRKGSTSGWQNVNLGIAYNRMNNFNSNITVTGKNAQGSLADTYVNDLNSGGKLDPFGSQLAYDTYLIDTIPGNSAYYFTPLNPHYGQTQTLQRTTYGSMGETDISFGANYGNILYLGATIGLRPSIKYNRNDIYTETSNDTSIYLKSFTKTDNLVTTGKGYNFKIGAIARLTDWVRVGAAVHSPTYYNLNDSWNSTITTTLATSSTSDTTISSSSPQGTYNYSLTTPMKAIGSVAFIFGKSGMLSGEYEYVNYPAARLNASDGSSFSTENNAIRSQYRSAGNIKIGTEWKWNIFSIRGGFNLIGNPYVGEKTFLKTNYSLGFGIRERGYYIDLAYILSKYTDNYYLYSGIETPTTTKYTSQSFILSMGLRF